MTTRVVMVNQTINTNHCAQLNFFDKDTQLCVTNQSFAHFVLQLCLQKIALTVTTCEH